MSFTHGEQFVLKGDEVFLVCNQTGDVTGTQPGAGLYLRDTRYLRHYRVLINGRETALLSSSGERMYAGEITASTQLLRTREGFSALPRTVGVVRRRIINQGLREAITVRNYNKFAVQLRLSVEVAADFKDMFEVRGFQRSRTGRLAPPQVREGGRIMTFTYHAIDARALEAEVLFDRLPAEQESRGIAEEADQRAPSGDELELLLPATERGQPLPSRRTTVLVAHFDLELAPGGADQLLITVRLGDLGSGHGTDGPESFQAAVARGEDHYTAWARENTRVTTANPQFTALLERGARDLQALLTTFPGGQLLAAGIPWYVAPFGRDSLIAAYQTLVLRPQLAVDTLLYLREFQATKRDPWRDAEPGKVLHEMRVGEMARVSDIPHTPYYGTIDATPLYVMLFVATVRWLDDERLFHDLLPTVRRCIEWIDHFGDRDGDGYVEYMTASKRGIYNQGWKDSADAVLWPDGSQPAQPIALVEVQGYVYAAKQGLGELLTAYGVEPQWAATLLAEARELKLRFNRDFWQPATGTFGMALDARKRLIPALTSNPGHALWCGIVADELAAPLVASLLSPDMDSGWGLRTLSAAEPQYNPMSYHNGSVWPHDNSLIIAGLRRYGFVDEANHVIGELFAAARSFRYLRLPELFCGFPRHSTFGSAPAEYPVTCSPQAWAAGTPYLFLQTLLALASGPGRNEASLAPVLPAWLAQVDLRGLRVGRGRVDIRVARNGDGAAKVDVERVEGDVTVHVHPWSGRALAEAPATLA